MKAIIPVAGAGTRLRPHSYTQPKALIPIAGKTVLSFIIDQLKEGGIQEFIFIIGYLGDKIHDYISENYPDIQASYLHQIDRQGVGHAIEMAKSITGDDEIMVVLGDTICEYNIEELMNAPYSALGVRKVEDPRDFGVVEIDEEGFIDHVIEKPQIPKSNLALVGVYKIKETALMFECLSENIRNGVKIKGEYNLTDAIECMLHKGVKFKPFKVDNWFDCGRMETVLETNATLLKKYNFHNHLQNSYENTVLIPPVSIGKNCIVKNSIIGPNVTIGNDTNLSNSIIRNSIIGAYSNLFDIVLEDSIIGSDTSLKGESRQLNIGDNTSIVLG